MWLEAGLAVLYLCWWGGGVVNKCMKPARPWDNLCLQIRLKDTMCVVICFYLLEGHQVRNKFSWRFEGKAMPLIVKKKKKAKLILFQCHIYHFQGANMFSGNRKAGWPSPAVPKGEKEENGGRAGRHGSTFRRTLQAQSKGEVMFFKKLLWPVGTHLTAGLNGQSTVSQCALSSTFSNAIMHFKTHTCSYHPCFSTITHMNLQNNNTHLLT